MRGVHLKIKFKYTKKLERWLLHGDRYVRQYYIVSVKHLSAYPQRLNHKNLREIC